jgi:Rhodanese-like domain
MLSQSFFLVAQYLSILFGTLDSTAPITQDTPNQATSIYTNELSPDLPSKVDFEGFLKLSEETYQYRKDRLVDLDLFLEMAKDSNTIILDTRSDKMYAMKHVKGAVHLNFADFNVFDLMRVIPSQDTRILIYCNNNINDDELFFPSKMARPVTLSRKPISLALNIPTFINLYGYGYRNIYELSSLVSVMDGRVQFEGAATVPSVNSFQLPLLSKGSKK